jgi:transcriptional regulator with XRE-family HTH domain
MRTPNGRQSSHKAGDDRNPQLALRWYDIPAELVWEFTVELCARFTLRDVAEMAGLAKETVRRYVERLAAPNLTTRQRLGNLYLDFNAGGVVVEEDSTKRWKARRRLIELLPPGQEVAREELAKLFDLAKQSGEFPEDLVDQLHDWMDLQVRGEYWAEDHYGGIARGERKRQPRGQPRRPRKRKAPPPGEGGE